MRVGDSMVPTVRGSQGKSGKIIKSGKVRENWEGQGKSGNFKLPHCKNFKSIPLCKILCITTHTHALYGPNLCGTILHAVVYCVG